MTRVFMLSVDNAPDHVNAFEIQNWTHYATHHNALTDDAIAFCRLAKTYTLDEFQEAFNLDIYSAIDNYIFITDLFNDNSLDYKQVCKHCGSEEVARCKWVNVNTDEIYSHESGINTEWCFGECNSETSIIDSAEYHEQQDDDDKEDDEYSDWVQTQ